MGGFGRAIANDSAHVSARNSAIKRGASNARRGAGRRLWLGIAAIFCGVIAFGIYSQAAQGGQLDAEVAQLRQQNTTLQQEISDRQREIVEAQTAAWLEEEARKLGYVLPGEKIFVLTPPGQPAPAAGGVSAPLPTFSPMPSPSPTPGAAHASPTPSATPTPAQFSLASPSPSPH